MIKFLRMSPPVKRQIVLVRTTDLKLSDWTADKSLVEQGAKALASPIMQAMLAVLRNESPMNYGLPMGANHDDRITHAAKAEGYMMAVFNLEAMGKQLRKAEYIESTFSPDNEKV